MNEKALIRPEPHYKSKNQHRKCDTILIVTNVWQQI